MYCARFSTSQMPESQASAINRCPESRVGSNEWVYEVFLGSSLRVEIVHSTVPGLGLGTSCALVNKKGLIQKGDRQST